MDECLRKNHSMVSLEIFFDHFKLGQIFSSKFNIVISRNFSISSEIYCFGVFQNFFQPSFNIGHLIIFSIFFNCIPIFDKFWLTLKIVKTIFYTEILRRKIDFFSLPFFVRAGTSEKICISTLSSQNFR